jgi:hypothetical protein
MLRSARTSPLPLPARGLSVETGDGAAVRAYLVRAVATANHPQGYHRFSISSHQPLSPPTTPGYHRSVVVGRGRCRGSTQREMIECRGRDARFSCPLPGMTRQPAATAAERHGSDPGCSDPATRGGSPQRRWQRPLDAWIRQPAATAAERHGSDPWMLGSGNPRQQPLNGNGSDPGCSDQSMLSGQARFVLGAGSCQAPRRGAWQDPARTSTGS